MPIYRADQSRLSFASEPGLAGFLDYISAVDEATDWTGVINGAVASGSRSVTFDGAGGTLAVNSYVLIGTVANGSAEVRRISSLGSYNGTGATGTVYLDQPTGFYHADNDIIDEKSATLAGLAGNSLVTFLPGVYENVTVPDMVPQIEPYYFLGTAAKRNWTAAYRGRQSFSGSLPNFILLNSYPLRFPLGTSATTGTDVGGGGGSTITGAHGKGQRSILVTAGNLYDNGDYIQIGTGTTAEVRQIISGAGADGLAETFILNYPLMFAHATLEALNEVTSPYTHTISESGVLDSMSWHLQMKDSDETLVNDFLRRYIGGKVNRASLRADEGGTLMMSWDEVPFTDLIHNQRFHSSVGGGATDITKYAGAMIVPAGVGGAIPHSGGALGTPTFPTNEPYYFSQSAISFFGTTFARIRSFTLEVNNNIEPRYYLKDTSSGRIPAELQEQRREYRLTARVALPDSIAAATSTSRTLFKELLLEGNYGSGMAGFDMSLVFTRSASDTITFTIPPVTAATGIDAQGSFIVRGANNIGAESPTEVDLEVIFRSLSIVSRDSDGVVP